MNLIECRAIIESLKNEHNAENKALIEFYERKEQELLTRINSGVKSILGANAPRVL